MKKYILFPKYEMMIENSAIKHEFHLAVAQSQCHTTY